MSNATLKAKSYTLYGKSHSKGPDGFSLNGKLRLPTIRENLGRRYYRTQFRGPLPMGRGEGTMGRVLGWRGRVFGQSYPYVIQRACCNTPQTLVKRSVMNQLGMLEERYMGILNGGYPKTQVFRVDKDASTYTKTQGRISVSCNTSGVSDYTEYYGNFSGNCTETGIYKGLNCCRGNTIAGSDTASTISKNVIS